MKSMTVTAWSLPALALAAALTALEPAGQPQPEMPAALVFLPDWGLEEPSRIRRGQVSLIHESSGPRLAVYFLTDEPPPFYSGRFISATPVFSGNTLVVADFDSGSRNLVGGYFSSFQRPPSQARTTLAAVPDGRRALRLTYRKEAGSYCGVWVHLFDYTVHPAERRYLDARPFSVFSFWVRGARGGERLLLKFADAEWEQKEDAFAIGELGDFLTSGQVETWWQQAVVPLDRLPTRISRSFLASVVFEAVGAGAGQLYIGSLAFSLQAAPLPPLPERPPEPDLAVRPLVKATWVWNTAELLDDSGQREELLGYLDEEEFDRVFLQLPGPPGERLPEGGLEVDERLRPLLTDLNRIGVEVYALDGFKDYALPAYHPALLRTIDNVIRYNRGSRPEERFYGFHYDIEPYLLPGFNGPRREIILQGYLELVAESARRAREAGLAYGVDIPFWYDAPNEYTYEPVTVEFGGVRKPASHHVIDLVDELTIMDYRTTAFGADGTVRHAEGELAYAASQGKPVLIGLETSPLPDEELLDFGGTARAGLPMQLPEQGLEAMAAKDDSTLVILVRAAERGEQDGTLDELAGWLRQRGVDPHATFWWPISKSTSVPGDKLSFADLGVTQLRGVMRETARELWRYDSFAGFALHHAWSHKKLLDQD
ncbi:MAG: hypothetical protein V3U13_10420 [Gemmatimonadota bacterium]